MHKPVITQREGELGNLDRRSLSLFRVPFVDFFLASTSSCGCPTFHQFYPLINPHTGSYYTTNRSSILVAGRWGSNHISEVESYEEMYTIAIGHALHNHLETHDRLEKWLLRVRCSRQLKPRDFGVMVESSRKPHHNFRSPLFRSSGKFLFH